MDEIEYMAMCVAEDDKLDSDRYGGEYANEAAAAIAVSEYQRELCFG